MSNVIALKARRKLATRRRSLAVDPLLAEIVDALAHFRGQAHRNDVCDQIASERAGMPRKASEALRQDVFSAFHRYADLTNAPSGRGPLLCRPLGPDSHRWALAEAGRDLFEARVSAEGA